MRTLHKTAWTLALLLGLALLYLLFWPVPIQPRAWLPAADLGYVEPHAANTRLADLHKIDLHGEEGPEHVLTGPDGKLYIAVASGKILRMEPDGGKLQVYANTGGRVLGFDFDAAGRLIAADAMQGLLSIGPNGQVTLLTDRADAVPIRYANAVVVAKSGKIYFSDASTRFAPRDWGGTFEASVLDILEQAGTGRVLEYDPASKATRVVAQGLSFANGVALSTDERSLYVNETGQYRIWKVAITAQALDLASLAKTVGAQMQASTEATVLFDNLPGYPDNLMRGLDGRIWVGLVKPRNPKVDQLASKPWLRSLTLRLPRALWPIPKAYGHVFAFNEAGQVVVDLQDPSGRYPETTSVTETPDRLYVQSLHARELGWLPR
ncbi:SMP-30/gluconolactonase/LRE family protein [Hylemonella gracilis]|uniref:SMP-30/gluconolactonase/LRE family protein n=1 Tax=Hylemonella gracilis TaxID=80880 RepID=A0A4P6UNN3_9BURK|nr:SMP-30/gluconolactonase/LRE family protein [Hylemonella gracilis]QBK06244.1 SMP-30/gluconolactonase/LRE family protein [Hylemonella gracilis]